MPLRRPAPGDRVRVTVLEPSRAWHWCGLVDSVDLDEWAAYVVPDGKREPVRVRVGACTVLLDP